MSARVELAKARLRLAADQAEPARLLRAAVSRSPFGSVLTSLLGAAALGFLSRRSPGARRGLGIFLAAALQPSRYKRLGR